MKRTDKHVVPPSAGSHPRTNGSRPLRREGRIDSIGRERPSLPTRECAAEGCGKKFIPIQKNNFYCSDPCREREKQRRLRQRAKLGIRG